MVEGLQASDREFFLGVQWHVECLAEHPAHAAIFAAFVEAARDREATEPARAA